MNPSNLTGSYQPLLTTRRQNRQAFTFFINNFNPPPPFLNLLSLDAQGPHANCDSQLTANLLCAVVTTHTRCSETWDSVEHGWTRATILAVKRTTFYMPVAAGTFPGFAVLATR